MLDKEKWRAYITYKKIKKYMHLPGSLSKR